MESPFFAVLILIPLLVFALYLRGKLREIRCTKQLRELLQQTGANGEVRGQTWSFDDDGNFNCVYAKRGDRPVDTVNPE